MKSKESPAALPVTAEKAPPGDWWFPILAVALFVVPILCLAGISLVASLVDNGPPPHFRLLTQMSVFQTALDMYAADNASYPDPIEGLNALVVRPAGKTNWHPYMERIPKDPWGRDYVYRVPNPAQPKIYDLRSVGPDGKVDTVDDILAPHAVSLDP